MSKWQECFRGTDSEQTLLPMIIPWGSRPICSLSARLAKVCLFPDKWRPTNIATLTQARGERQKCSWHVAQNSAMFPEFKMRERQIRNLCIILCFKYSFYALSRGSLHFVLYVSSNNHLFQRIWLAVGAVWPIRKWFKKPPWKKTQG